MIVLLFIQNNFSFKNKLNILTSIDDEFIFDTDVYRQVSEMKGCSVPQIFSK